MSSRPVWSRAAHHIGRRDGLTLPVRYQSPDTGVVVEIDCEGVVTFVNGEPGEFRSFDKMRIKDLRISGPAYEIKVLTKAHWKRI